MNTQAGSGKQSQSPSSCSANLLQCHGRASASAATQERAHAKHGRSRKRLLQALFQFRQREQCDLRPISQCLLSRPSNLCEFTGQGGAAVPDRHHAFEVFGLKAAFNAVSSSLLGLPQIPWQHRHGPATHGQSDMKGKLSQASTVAPWLHGPVRFIIIELDENHVLNSSRPARQNA